MLPVICGGGEVPDSRNNLVAEVSDPSYTFTKSKFDSVSRDVKLSCAAVAEGQFKIHWHSALSPYPSVSITVSEVVEPLTVCVPEHTPVLVT